MFMFPRGRTLITLMTSRLVNNDVHFDSFQRNVCCSQLICFHLSNTTEVLLWTVLWHQQRWVKSGGVCVSLYTQHQTLHYGVFSVARCSAKRTGMNESVGKVQECAVTRCQNKGTSFHWNAARSLVVNSDLHFPFSLIVFAPWCDAVQLNSNIKLLKLN